MEGRRGRYLPVVGFGRVRFLLVSPLVMVVLERCVCISVKEGLAIYSVLLLEKPPLFSRKCRTVPCAVVVSPIYTLLYKKKRYFTLIPTHAFAILLTRRNNTHDHTEIFFF